MDSGIREILEFLALENVVGASKDISYSMNGIFPIENATFDKHNLERFLDDLGKYTTYNKSIPFTRKPPYGFSKLIIALTNDGSIALKKEQDRIKQGEVNQSSIDLSRSIIATNNAVQNMDARMPEHAERQESIMLQQSGFTQQQVTFTAQQVTLIEKQVTLIGTQNKLYRNTLILTGANILIGVIILVITIISYNDKKQISTLQLQLTEQQKEIKRLQLLKSDTVHYVLHYPLLKSKKR